MSENGMISFDLDGVLANFTRGFTRIAHDLFGTPVGDGSSQQSWMFEEFPELELNKDRCDASWAIIKQSPHFWTMLDPFNVSVMERINRIKNKIFITNRLGINPAQQSIDFLNLWGVENPKVIVAAKKGPVSIEENVVAHIDDYYPNCVDIRAACPKAYTALLYCPYNKIHHDEWYHRHCGELVLSVDHFINVCEERQLIDYEY